MKSYLISDNVDTLVGLEIAGIKGIVLHDRNKVIEKLDELLKNKDIGIIIVTEKIEILVTEKIDKLKLEKNIPLIVAIPDRHGSNKEENSIMKYVKESIGLKV